MFKNFNDEIVSRYKAIDSQANCRNITFQVTDDCCLKCTYCYQTHKGHAMMTIEMAKSIIDLLFKMYEDNNEEAFINHHTYGLILELIGGEPFMNIEVMDFIASYFFNECVKRDHIWLMNSRLSISTNGILYFSPKVQEFINKYKSLISLTITIDGPKEIHDACRIDLEGNGSFDRAIAAWEHWYKVIKTNYIATKVTIAPDNLIYLEQVVNFFLDRGCKQLYINPIYEHPWAPKEASLYYSTLIKFADRILADEQEAYCSLFTEHCGRPMLSTQTKNWCGGTSAMLAFDPEGKAYPCLRYMPSSLGDKQPPIIIGDNTGIYNTPATQAIYKDMQNVTRQSQSSEECIDCPVAEGCGYCSALNYQETGSYNKRLTYTCWMHRARALANVYYWNQYYIKHKIPKTAALYLPRNIATQIISDEEYDKLLQLSWTFHQ